MTRKLAEHSEVSRGTPVEKQVKKMCEEKKSGAKKMSKSQRFEIKF